MKNRKFNWSHGAAASLALLGPVIALHAHAEVYLSEAQAINAIFPGVSMTETAFELNDEDVKKIESLSDQKVRLKKLKVWRSKDKKQTVFIDEVLGKHEFITYAVGLDANGKVVGIEVLEYRESYGQGVRKPEWTRQFIGKDTGAKLKLDDDIKNISGATLSSAHMTAGVRRILQTYAQIHARL